MLFTGNYSFHHLKQNVKSVNISSPRPQICHEDTLNLLGISYGLWLQGEIY